LLRQFQEGGNLADKLDHALTEITPQTGRDSWSEAALRDEGIGKE
jgi:hypothetical protein